jgi:hypothetical protein
MSDGGKLWLTTSLVEENHDIGLYVTAGEAMVLATVVRATKQAPAGLEFGDGILAMADGGPSHVTLTATESTDNARAGVLYMHSTGELSHVRASGNRFGLVVQPGDSGLQPEFGEGNVFEGNREQDTLTDGDLQVPPTTVPVP